MKNAMPRLIDDKRLWWRAEAGAITTGAVVLALLAHSAYMRPFTERRTRLREVVREGRAFNEKFRFEVEGGSEIELDQALERLENQLGISVDLQEPAPLEMDSSLYVAEDRPKATELQEAYTNEAASWSRGKDEFDAAANRCAALAQNLRELREAPVRKGAEEALSNLGQCLVELEAFLAQSRPKERPVAVAMARFSETLAHAYDARAAFGGRDARVDAALADAKTMEENARAASGRLKDSEGRMAAIIAEVKKLRPDPNGERFKALRQEVAKAAVALENGEVAMRNAIKSADDERAGLLEKGLAYCNGVAEKAAARDEAHCALLPQDSVASARKAPEKFKGVASEGDGEWKKQLAAAEGILNRSRTLRDECSKAVQTLDKAIKEGTVPSDSAQIAGLPERAAAVGDELSAAEASLSFEDQKRRLATIVSQAKKDLEAIERATPDIPTHVAKIRQEAEAIRGSLDSASGSLTGLRKTIEEGSGEAKETLRTSAAGCVAAISTAEIDVRAAEEASPSNGKDVITLNERLGSVRNSVKTLQTKISDLEAEIKKAIENGSFSLVSWEAGAVGWNPNDNWPSKTVLAGDSLVAPDGTACSSYRWEFAIDIALEGDHRIEVRASPSAESSVFNLNTAMPDRGYRGGEDRKYVSGGWIKTECSLASGDLSWSDSCFLPNKAKVKSREIVVLDKIGRLAKGRAMFRLDIDLAVDTSKMDEKQKASLPDVSRGWRPAGIEFTVFLDSELVRQFWHRAD